MSFRTFFHYISYLQYPLMLLGVYFMIEPYLHGFENVNENPNVLFQSLNSVLIFMGLALSFSSLQDTTKTQNKLSENIWKDPKKGKILIGVIGFQILSAIVLGLLGYYFIEGGVLKQLSIGLIVLGLGMFGFLKAAIEMFENHRVDKNSNVKE